MESLVVDNKKKEILFQDQNKKIVYLLRFVFGLNIVNAVIFFSIFNNQDDFFKWIWLVFALINLAFLYLCFVKLSIQDKLIFSEIDSIEIKSVFGLVFKLNNGKFRKIYINRDSQEAEKLIKSFLKKV